MYNDHCIMVLFLHRNIKAFKAIKFTPNSRNTVHSYVCARAHTHTHNTVPYAFTVCIATTLPMLLFLVVKGKVHFTTGYEESEGCKCLTPLKCH